MSKLHNLVSRKNKKNRRVPHTTAVETKATAEQQALQKLNTTTAVQKVASRTELITAAEQQISQAAGVNDLGLAAVILSQAKEAGWCRPEITVAMMREIKPENVMQAFLAVQMVGVHHAALSFLNKASSPVSSEATDADLNRANRLMRLYCEQLDAMAKLKGKTGQQKVTVEHVHVHQGGQAIVGAVTAARGTGGGAEQEGKSVEGQGNSAGKAAGLAEKRKSARRLLAGGSLRS